MFRRCAGGGVSGPAALRFLLQDPRFPRSVEFCLNTTSRALVGLPRATSPLTRCAAMRSRLAEVEITEEMTPERLHDLADVLESGIGGLHDTLAHTYFRPGSLPTEEEPGPAQRQTFTADAS
jgi:uncharacterized alpha-E superfamily protein